MWGFPVVFLLVYGMVWELGSPFQSKTAEGKIKAMNLSPSCQGGLFLDRGQSLPVTIVVMLNPRRGL